MKQGEIKALTSLRFFAALMVLLSHTGSFGEGHIGVLFFFILSGFVIAYAYEAALVSGGMEGAKYLAYRAARIYPLQWLTLAIFCFVTMLGADGAEGFSQGTLLQHAFLAQGFSPDMEIHAAYTAVSWSLSAEMFFYIAFVILVRLETVYLVLLASGIALLMVGLIPSRHGLELVQVNYIEQHAKYFAYIFPPSRLVDFVTGVILFRVWACAPSPGYLVNSLFQAASIVCLVLLVWFHRHIDWIFRYGLYYLIPMAGIVFSFASPGWFSRLVSARTMVFLGHCSFSMYMTHYMIILFLGEELRHVVAGLAMLTEQAQVALFSLVVFLITLLASIACHLAFEKPSTRFLRKYIDAFFSGRAAQVEGSCGRGT